MLPSQSQMERRIAELEVENKRLIELNRHLSAQILRFVHDLRTPLTNLNLRLYLLEHGQPDRQADYVMELKQYVVQVDKMANEFLTTARHTWHGLDEDFDSLDS